MCGLIGVVSTDGVTLRNKRTAFLEQAFKVGHVRGEDATGMFWVDKDKKVDYYKRATDGMDFAYHRIPKKVILDTDVYPIIIGHHRFKTHGSKTRQEAHPFEVGHITLVHNGGISNSFSLPGYEKQANEPNVDSYRLTYAMANKGAIPVLEQIGGAYSLIWWDAEQQALFFTRNEDRPLSLAFDEQGTSCYIASEVGMLQWLLSRNGIKVRSAFSSPKPYSLWKLEFDGKKPLELSSETYSKKYVPAPSIQTTRSGMYGSRGYQQSPSNYRYRQDSNLFPRPDRVPANLPEDKDAEAQGKENCPPLLGNKSKQIEANLRRFGKKYGDQVWGIPMGFACYSISNGRGDVIFTLAGNEDEHIYVHNIAEEDYDELIEDSIAVAIDITNAQSHHLVGKINWAASGKVNVFIQGLENSGDDNLKIIPGPRGTRLTGKEWNALTKNGCCLCGNNVFAIDAEEIEYVDNEPLCEKCQDELALDEEEGDEEIAQVH